MPNTTYLRLFPAVKQFELKNGALNVGGRLFVYYEGTDDLAEIFDEDGSRLQQPAILDNDGRALGLFVDAARLYRLEVQDAFGAMQFTVSKMAPSGGGSGSALGNQYDIISSDGSIAVDKYDDAGVTKFDLGIAPQSDEFLEWIKCSGEDCGSTWIPVYQSGTMETTELGIKVHAGQLYHFTNTFTVDPDGTGINYDTFQVLMYLNDQVVDTRKFDIDSSLNDAVQCEFSHDLVPSVDGFVSFKLTIPATCEVSGEVQCHRIYSGINAVPDTCATKQWVSGNYQSLSGMSSYVPYSAMDHNIVGQVTGINGSAIVGSLDSATVSSIASSVASAYTESALSSISSWSADISSISSKADASSLTAYQPVSAMSAYATESYVDSAVSGKLDTSAYDSAQFQQASAMSSWIPYSALDYSGTAISGIGGSSLAGMGGGGADYSGIYPVNIDNTAREISVDSLPLVTDSSMTAYGSAGSSVIGVNLDILSAKQDASAMTAYQLSGDYVFNSALSGYIPTSESANYQQASGMSAYQLTADMTAYQPSGDYAYSSAVSSKADSSALTAYQLIADMSAYIPTSESANYQQTSGMSAYQLTADMTAYQLLGDYAFNSSLADYQPVTGMSAYQPAGDYQPSGDYIYVSALGWAEVN